MTQSDEVREFLTSRRARITPEQAGLALYGGNRRVAGLRREEVAMLAGMSVDYYTRLERGNLSGASDGVLEALARALQLDDAETAHLYDLARAAHVAPRARRKRSPTAVRPSLQRVIDAISTAPAWIRNDRGDVLAANELGRALYLDLMSEVVQPPNNARFTFLNPKAREFYTNWSRAADDIVAILRSAAGRNPYDKDLTDLIGELSTRSEDFRVRWARHDVRYHRTGRKQVHHPIVGELDLAFEAMDLPGDPGLRLNVYTADPGTPSEDALKLLASWAATQSQPAPEAPQRNQNV
ncbi:helix-turn-helix domain-containing protein [Diaminobutyricibacter tongyongensis]|uniref:Helix-turn-helix domain-containing protein n=1 Tax=Leifsonia tongyongensis TaxID=1268043 RepID=A0A6L9XUY6_9MICO|nr:helix-turn-helix transcriptional regulator [Diaminobutyricibacter tongyongensis]NEN05047.1 helix-turn-helix domain-containing protein [Diaminobutyricibacter tongyongensis]